MANEFQEVKVKVCRLSERYSFIYGEPSQISDDNLIRVTLKEIWNELDTQYVQAYNVKGDLEYIAEYTVSLVPLVVILWLSMVRQKQTHLQEII